MRTANNINKEEKWKEALEEWTPDVDITGWEDVASRIPSGRAFGVRRCVERLSAKALRSVARFVSFKVAVVAVASAIVSGYVTYRVVEGRVDDKEVKVQVLDNPSSQSPKSLDARNANGDGLHNSSGGYALVQPACGKQSESDAAPSDPIRYLGASSAVNGGSSASNRNISEGGSANAPVAPVRSSSISRKDNNAAAASTGLTAFSTRVSAVAPVRSSSISRNDINKAIASKGRTAFSTRASAAPYQRNVPSPLAQQGGRGGSPRVLQDSASHTAEVSAAASVDADAVKSRRWIKKRSIAEPRTRSKLKRRALPDAASSSDVAAVEVEPLSSSRGSSFAKRDLPEAPIGRGSASMQKYHLGPSRSTGSFLTIEYPEYHVPFKRYLSYFWGVSLDGGAARSGSSTLVFVGANAFVGSMYKEKVGLMLSVGGRWIGDLPKTLQVDSNSDISIPEIDPDSLKRASSLQSYYQAVLGLDGVVSLYSGVKTSFGATLGVRGCFTQRVKGDSTAKRIIPLSAVRFSASYRRKTSVGNIFVSPFAEYQLNGAGPLSKSAILVGVNVGVIF